MHNRGLYLLERKDLSESGRRIWWKESIQHTQDGLLLLLALATIHYLLGEFNKSVITWLI